MQVTYKPEGKPEDNRSWEFNPERVRANRAEMIETRYGQRYAEWVKEIQAGQVRARRVLLWHLMNLDHPTFKMEDVPDFAFGELELDYAVSDLQKIRREVAESAMEDAVKDDTLRRLDMEIATRLGKNLEEVTAEDLGKDLTSDSSASNS